MIRRLLLLDHPQETRFFLFVGAFGLALATVYWFLTYEVAGTVLLLGFGAGAGLLGVGLYRSRPGAVRAGADAARRDADASEAGRDGGDASAVDQVTAGGEDVPGGGAGGVDTPFSTPLGRLPGETLAPLALGLGMALGLTAVVFGPWLLVAGLVPLAWGAWTWLTAARDELRAAVRQEAPETAPDLAPDLVADTGER
ncbi:MAG TPA: hypothetical protein VKB30_03495 [Candidatus Limnocylindrales bacterium]|nr:hypothetical protein [Candidatus Limnocylindrales bacterium]